jgi:diguanylate cyclase (GGDEF)-like protein
MGGGSDPIGSDGSRSAEIRREASPLFQGFSRMGSLAISLGMVLCVGLGDYLTGPALFTLLYLGPIGFGTWFVGLRAGLALSLLSSVISFVTDLDNRNGGVAPELSPVVESWNLFVQLGVFVALAVLLDAFRSRLVLEQQLARTDPLTQVANRRAFLEAAELEVERARRHRRALTVAYLDCDDFKRVNDRFGHEGGDALLALAGATLRAATRTLDTVARLGGDEFGLLLPETDGPTAESLVARLRAALHQALHEGGWPATFSMGVVTFLSPPGSVDEMIGIADQLMYEAKRAGKDQVRFAVVDSRPPLRAAPAGS